MGYAQAAFFSGFGLGPLMGGALTAHFGITATFLSMGCLNLLAFLLTLSLLPEVRGKKTSDNSHLSFREMCASGTVKGIFSFRLTEAIGRGGTSAFLPLFAANIGLSITLIGTLLTVSILTVTIFTPLGGMLADKFNRRALIVIGMVIFIMSMVAITMANDFEQLLAVLFMQGISGAICMPAASALIVEEGRKYGMGSTMSTMFLALSIGMTIGPLVSGVTADFANINSVFYTTAGIGIIGISLLIWFTR